MAPPVIVELALNGATSRVRNRHVPRTPEEITEVALEGIALGATIVHNHNDEPMFTLDAVHAAEPYIAAWEPVLACHPDVLLYPTMGAGARGIPVQRRWAHVEELARRGLGGMTLVDPGSVNVGLTSGGEVARARRRRPLPQLLPRPGYMFARSARPARGPQHLGLRTRLPAHHAHLAPAGKLAPGAIVKLYFGGELEFGLPPTLKASGRLPGVARAVRAALVGGGAGRRRGGVRAGRARDPARRPRPRRAGGLRRAGQPSNADLLRGVMALIDRLDRRPAEIAETRATLGVPTSAPGATRL